MRLETMVVAVGGLGIFGMLMSVSMFFLQMNDADDLMYVQVYRDPDVILA